MFRIFNVALVTVGLTLAQGPDAKASPVPVSYVAAIYAIPAGAGAFALTTTIGSAVAPHKRAWFVAGYIAGGLSLTAGAVMMSTSDPDNGSKTFYFMGLTKVVFGLSSVAMSIYNQSKPRPVESDIWLEHLSVAPTLIRAPATREQAPGLVLSGRF